MQNCVSSLSYIFQVLYPKCQVNSLQLWTSVYLSTNSSFASPDEVHPPVTQTVPITENGEAVNLPKTRSCENLLSMTDHTASPSRRRSDPNITMELGEQTTKLLKDAMAGQDGDTSCSSESIRSSNNTSFSDNISESVNGHSESVNSHDKENSSIQNSSTGDKDSVICNGVALTNGYSSDKEAEINAHEVNHSETNGEIRTEEHTESSRMVNGHSETVLMNGINGHEHLENGPLEEHIEGLKGNMISSNAQHLGYSNGLTDCHITTNGAHSANENNSRDFSHPNSIPNGSDTVDDIERDNEIVSDSTQNKLLQKRLSGDRLEPCLEGSTDTLIEDGVKDLQKDDSEHTLTPSVSNGKVYEVKTLKSLCDISSSSNKLLSLRQASSISTATSTSDLTDSRVGQEGSKLNGALGHMFQNSGPCDSIHNSLKLKCILAQSVLSNGSTSGCSRHGMNGEHKDLFPSCSTSLSPQSRNSTCPPTPGTGDGKVSHRFR